MLAVVRDEVVSGPAEHRLGSPHRLLRFEALPVRSDPGGAAPGEVLQAVDPDRDQDFVLAWPGEVDDGTVATVNAMVTVGTTVNDEMIAAHVSLPVAPAGSRLVDGHSPHGALRLCQPNLKCRYLVAYLLFADW
jgi:hypothetical protein